MKMDIRTAVENAVERIFDFHELHMTAYSAVSESQLFRRDTLRSHENLVAAVMQATLEAAQFETEEEILSFYDNLTDRIIEQIKTLMEIAYGDEAKRLARIETPYRRYVEKYLDQYITPASALRINVIKQRIRDLHSNWYPVIMFEGRDYEQLKSALNACLDGLKIYRVLVDTASEHLRETRLAQAQFGATRYAGRAVMLSVLSVLLTAFACFLALNTVYEFIGSGNAASSGGSAPSIAAPMQEAR